MRSVFDPVVLAEFRAPNRIVMAPMTRGFSPGGVPGEDVKAYYVRRAEGGAGTIITEGLEIGHPGSVYDSAIPNLFEDDALFAWARIFDAIHVAGAKVVPQLWHVGGARAHLNKNHRGEAAAVSPSGVYRPGERIGAPMTKADIGAVIDAYGRAAEAAFRLGCDGIEIHAAHGYLIDQFFWGETNLRIDCYGGDLSERTRFGAEVVKECRRRTTPGFPIFFRFSQWKLQDYGARLAETPQALEEFLKPLVDAGVDIFDCSTRRFWVPEFEGSELGLAGWTRRLSGKATMTVGSVGLDGDVVESMREGAVARTAGLDRLEAMLERGDFDLVGVGRALLGDSQWVRKVRDGAFEDLRPFSPAHLRTLS